jgi:hypothetical protein
MPALVQDSDAELDATDVDDPGTDQGTDIEDDPILVLVEPLSRVFFLDGEESSQEEAFWLQITAALRAARVEYVTDPDACRMLIGSAPVLYEDGVKPDSVAQLPEWIMWNNRRSERLRFESYVPHTPAETDQHCRAALQIISSHLSPGTAFLASQIERELARAPDG